MTSRETTSLLALPDRDRHDGTALSDRAYRWLFGAIGWPWLLYSLWGGTRASKTRLLHRIGLDADALPHLGSWKADTGFLHRIVDAVEELRPRTVVELGAGASTLVCAKALAAHGGGHLTSYDQHAEFVAATSRWLTDNGVRATLRHAPLERRTADWPGRWYDLTEVPPRIDLLIIDGPPWAVHPYVRGAADTLFDRLSPGGIVLLDDAARPGERIVARRWRRRHPDMTFQRMRGSTKGTLIGRKTPSGASGNVVPLPTRRDTGAGIWRYAAALPALLGMGWMAHDPAGGLAEQANAAIFVDEASAAYADGVAHRGSHGHAAPPAPAALARLAGVYLPTIPAGWHLLGAQVRQAGARGSVTLTLRNPQGDVVSLYATRAETPAEGAPLLDRREDRSVAYWEAGPFAYALTAPLQPARVQAMAADIARATPASS